MITKTLGLAAALLTGLPAAVMAIPYPTPGVVNAANYVFVAQNTGDIIGYFYGSSAAYGSVVGLIVNNITQGTYGLQNHLSAVGDSFNMGSVTAGDVLSLELQVSITNPNGPTGPGDLLGSLYSDPTLNPGGLQHIYAEVFGGAGLIPAGLYVGWEDIIRGGDLDYNDHQFVFTNVGTTVPDGASTLVLAGLGLAALGMFRRKIA